MAKTLINAALWNMQNRKAVAACNMVHAMDALGLNKMVAVHHDEFQMLDSVVSQVATPEVNFFAVELHEAEEAIKALPIDRLDERQGMLVDLLVMIVNHETENGELTVKAGNNALESMEYWSTLGIYTASCGFKRLGNGHFSAAYSHPMLPGKVIKVGFKKEDSGAAYVAFCRMHQGRQGIPTIHDVQRHAGCYTVVMDALEESQSKVYNDPATNRQFALAVAGVEHGHLSDVKPAEEYRKIELDLAETAIEINKFFKGIARFDMHSGNVMLDKQGNIVITDPVSFSHDVKATEFQIDPEELLKEIEAVALKALVARCKARKDKRSPEAIAARKAHIKQVKETKRRRAAHLRNIDRREALEPSFEALRNVLGKERVANIWQHNHGDVLRKVGQAAIDKEMNHVQACVIWGLNTLPMDNRLDKQFLQG